MAVSRNPGEYYGRLSRQQFEETAATAMDTAKKAVSSISESAESAAHTVGNRLKSLAYTVRDKGPHEGVLGSAASSLASGIECSGSYLETKGLKGMADDLSDLIRKNPIPSLLIAFGLGCCLARTTLRR